MATNTTARATTTDTPLKTPTRKKNFPERVCDWADRIGNHLTDRIRAHDERCAKACEDEKSRTRVLTSRRPLRVQVLEGMRFSILPLVALLVVRHLWPEVAEEIAPFYWPIDNVVLPVLKWFYTMFQLAWEKVMADGSVPSLIIEAIRTFIENAVA